VSRRSRRSEAAAARAAKGAAEPQAAPGIDFNPVHGRHCICGRCETQSRRRAS